MKPTLHVTNWSSRKLHGPGWAWTIMRRPRAWERGHGRVAALTPTLEDLEAVRTGAIDSAEYARRCEARFRGAFLAPGQLLDETGQEAVRDGDTLCCACSREAAAAGACHRVVASRLLAEAGWHVVLDGAEVSNAQ